MPNSEEFDSNSTTILVPTADQQQYMMELRQFQKSLQPYFAAVYAIFFLTGLSNFAVLYIMASVKKLRTVCTFQVFNLCLTGCLFTLTLPLVTYFTITKHFPLNETMCKVSRSLTTMTKLAGILFITLASIERYLGVCHPTRWKQKWTWTMVISLTCCAWLLSILINSPITIYSGFPQSPPNSTLSHQRCQLMWPDMDRRTWTSRIQRIYVTSIFVTLFVLPTLVILYCYIRIVMRIRSAAKRMNTYDQRNSSASRRPTESTVSQGAGVDMTKAQSNKRHNTKRRKVNKTILILIAFYLFCWGPYWILILLKSYRLINGRGKFIYVVFNILQFLPYLNSSLNPFLYGFMTANFKAVVKAKYGCCYWNWRGRRRASHLEGETTVGNNDRKDGPPGITFSRVTTFANSFKSTSRKLSNSDPPSPNDHQQLTNPFPVKGREEHDKIQRQNLVTASDSSSSGESTNPIREQVVVLMEDQVRVVKSASNYCLSQNLEPNVPIALSGNDNHHERNIVDDDMPQQDRNILINQNGTIKIQYRVTEC